MTKTDEIKDTIVWVDITHRWKSD